MGKLKNTEKLHGMAIGDSVTIGNNRTVSRVNGGWRCMLHGNGIAFVSMSGGCEILHMTLSDCGYLTPTTRDAMQDFARAFGAALSVSIAGGVLTYRFKNGAGAWQERKAASGDVAGPYAMGRYISPLLRMPGYQFPNNY